MVTVSNRYIIVFCLELVLGILTAVVLGRILGASLSVIVIVNTLILCVLLVTIRPKRP